MTNPKRETLMDRTPAAPSAELVALREALEAVWSSADANDTPLADVLSPELFDLVNSVLKDSRPAAEAARAAIEAPWREAAQAVLDEWDSFGPTGTLSTLATHRRLRALLTQPEKEDS